MLSFATEFPLPLERTKEDFVAAVRTWLLDSPHTLLVPDDLTNLNQHGEQETRKGTQSIKSIYAKFDGNEVFAVKNAMFDGEIEWVTDLVFSKRANDSWVGIRTSRESSAPAIKLPPAKKPRIVLALMQHLGGALDSKFNIDSIPIYLSNNDIDLAANIMNGSAGLHLPVVYLSYEFSGKYTVDPGSLAHNLAGMAHVVLEPNRPFSRRLKIEIASENVYGGAIGIYWPDASGRRSVFHPSYFAKPAELKQAIIEEIRAALLNRRSIFRCTWTAAQEVMSKENQAEFTISGSNIANQWAQSFDQEIIAKKEELANAEKEIIRLKLEIRKYESLSSAGISGLIRQGSEQDLYDDEIRNIVIDVIRDGLSRAQTDGRREHVLQSVIDANPANSISSKFRESLKETLREYKSMDKIIRSKLETLGFLITDTGKHYKLIFRSDDRYTFVLPKSGSDYRGGLNSASDISKRLF